MTADKQILAIYDDDKFIDVGTLEELHTTTGLSIQYIRWLSQPISRKRATPLVVIKIDMENDI